MISVIITTYKREPKMLRRAIDSVINQTYTDWEIIIVDDSPEDYALRDDVRDMVLGLDGNIRYVRHEKNMGVSAARNTGIVLAKGEYVAFLDDDDEWLPEKLDMQLRAFTPETGFVYCRNYYVDDSTGDIHEVMKPKREGNIYGAIMRENFVGSPSFVMVRAECLREAGGFPVETPRVEACEDWDLWIRLAEKYNAGFVDTALVKYHDNHGEHGDTLLKRIRGQEYIYTKYAKYIHAHPYIMCKRLSALSSMNRKAGNYRKALKYFVKALPFQVFRLGTHIKEFVKGEK